MGTDELVSAAVCFVGKLVMSKMVKLKVAMIIPPR